LDPEVLISCTVDLNLVFWYRRNNVLLLCSSIRCRGGFISLSQKDLDESMQTNATKGRILSGLLNKPKKLLLLVANNFINIAVVILFSFIG
jgi:Mg2+/Co2+ transporter CorB